MALSNDSILVTPGSGATVATHTVGGKEHQVVMIADDAGHIVGSRNAFMVYFTPATNAASRSVADLFNADAAAVVRVRGIWIIPTLTAITGVQVGWDINRTSTVGTGGTAETPRPIDTAQTALDADITARAGATGGATLVYKYLSVFCLNDETNAGAGILAYQNQLPVFGDRIAEIVLRQNQGIQVKQSITATVGLTGALMYFTVE
jgi:hypothetical protein